MTQLIWILGAAVMGFLVSFIFGNSKKIHLDIYYLIYFACVGILYVLYIRQTNLDLKQLINTNLVFGIVLGLILAFVQAKNVFSRPETKKFVGGKLAWAVIWRGLFYGTVDGLLLSSFPWIVTWRSFNVADKPLIQQLAFTFLSWLFILFVTTVYHAGYKDFPSKKILQANIGNSLISLSTFISGNPIASPITHAGMHIAAVIHSPQTELYLPPHR